MPVRHNDSTVSSRLPKINRTRHSLNKMEDSPLSSSSAFIAGSQIMQAIGTVQQTSDQSSSASPQPVECRIGSTELPKFISSQSCSMPSESSSCMKFSLPSSPLLPCQPQKGTMRNNSQRNLSNGNRSNYELSLPNHASNTYPPKKSPNSQSIVTHCSKIPNQSGLDSSLYTTCLSNSNVLDSPKNHLMNFDSNKSAQFNVGGSITSIDYSSLPLPQQVNDDDVTSINQCSSDPCIRCPDDEQSCKKRSNKVSPKSLHCKKSKQEIVVPMEGIKEGSCLQDVHCTGSEESGDSDGPPSWDLVKILQDEIISLQKENAELKLELHQSKLLCAEMNSQLSAVQHWQEPGYVADLIGELHAANKVRDQALMARLKLANEERDAVLKAYTLRKSIIPSKIECASPGEAHNPIISCSNPPNLLHQFSSFPLQSKSPKTLPNDSEEVCHRSMPAVLNGPCSSSKVNGSCKTVEGGSSKVPYFCVKANSSNTSFENVSNGVLSAFEIYSRMKSEFNSNPLINVGLQKLSIANPPDEILPPSRFPQNPSNPDGCHDGPLPSKNIFDESVVNRTQGCSTPLSPPLNPAGEAAHKQAASESHCGGDEETAEAQSNPGKCESSGHPPVKSSPNHLPPSLAYNTNTSSPPPPPALEVLRLLQNSLNSPFNNNPVNCLDFSSSNGSNEKAEGAFADKIACDSVGSSDSDEGQVCEGVESSLVSSETSSLLSWRQGDTSPTTEVLKQSPVAVLVGARAVQTLTSCGEVKQQLVPPAKPPRRHSTLNQVNKASKLPVLIHTQKPKQSESSFQNQKVNSPDDSSFLCQEVSKLSVSKPPRPSAIHLKTQEQILFAEYGGVGVMVGEEGVNVCSPEGRQANCDHSNTLADDSNSVSEGEKNKENIAEVESAPPKPRKKKRHSSFLSNLFDNIKAHSSPSNKVKQTNVVIESSSANSVNGSNVGSRKSAADCTQTSKEHSAYSTDVGSQTDYSASANNVVSTLSLPKPTKKKRKKSMRKDSFVSPNTSDDSGNKSQILDYFPYNSVYGGNGVHFPPNSNLFGKRDSCLPYSLPRPLSEPNNVFQFNTSGLLNTPHVSSLPIAYNLYPPVHNLVPQLNESFSPYSLLTPYAPPPKLKQSPASVPPSHPKGPLVQKSSVDLSMGTEV